MSGPDEESAEPTESQLRAAFAWEAVDRVTGEPDVSAFKRRARYHQALWRHRNGLEIGSEPMRPTTARVGRSLGSRIRLDGAEDSAANFLGDTIRQAVRYRLAHSEKDEMIGSGPARDRLFCDLLSSMPMCFNLFGSLHGDMEAAARAVRRWWPEAPGEVSAMRFEWSPGRLDPAFLGNRSAFDVAFELSVNGGSGIIGVETKYHENARRPEPKDVPRGQRLVKYTAVTESARIFRSGALSAVMGTDLQQIWLDHLLALSMTQHASRRWRWAKFVLVHPERNPSFAQAGARYRALLSDPITFEVRTVESMLCPEALSADVIASFRHRYLW